MGGWVSAEEVSIQYPGTDPAETALGQTPALWDGSCRWFGDFQDQPGENFDNAELIWGQWVKMFLKECGTEVWEVHMKGTQGNKWLATDLGERTDSKAWCNLIELPNTSFMIVIRWVLNGNNGQSSSNPLQASCTGRRNWGKLIDIIELNFSPKEPHCLTAIYQHNLTQEELDKVYMGLYEPGQLINDRLYGQISYNITVSNVFTLILGHNSKLFLAERKAATVKDSAEHIIKPAKVIPAIPCYS